MAPDAFFEDTQDAIRGGADLNRKGRDGITLLHYWVNVGRADIVELLLDHRAGVNLPDDSRWTALHFAAAKGDLEMVRLLVARGADINAIARSPATRTFLDRLLGRPGKMTPRRAALNAGHSAVADFLGQREGVL